MKRLNELISFSIPDEIKQLPVTDIFDNSKNVAPGGMFIALNGFLANGKNYVDEAISRGAKYIVLDSDDFSNYIEIRGDVIFIFVKNARRELAHIASRFFSSDFDCVVAVTGTNGKSSVVNITEQIWNDSQINAASIGTLGVITRENCETLPDNLTSPGTVQLHKILNRLSNSGIKNVALEASSHGIIQHRIDNIKFAVCAFTNFTQDHLDYHKTLENYWSAKEILFSKIAFRDTVFVINADDDRFHKIQEIAKNRKIKYVSYGYKSQDIRIEKVEQIKNGQNVRASFFGKEISFVLPLYGAFQVHNSLCAAAICYLTNTKIDNIFNALSRLHFIKGRLELISKIKSASIYVDYAHSPDALKNAILSLRDSTKNKIITVFGCGGNRDQYKRPLMGKIAREFSDVVIVTDDNPRYEDPQQIRKMILDACPNAIEIADRKNAIEFAMNMLSEGDSLLIAGKGHENYQQISNEFVHFSDKEVVLNREQK